MVAKKTRRFIKRTKKKNKKNIATPKDVHCSELNTAGPTCEMKSQITT